MNYQQMYWETFTSSPMLIVLMLTAWVFVGLMVYSLVGGFFSFIFGQLKNIKIMLVERKHHSPVVHPSTQAILNETEPLIIELQELAPNRTEANVERMKNILEILINRLELHETNETVKAQLVDQFKKSRNQLKAKSAKKERTVYALQ